MFLILSMSMRCNLDDVESTQEYSFTREYSLLDYSSSQNANNSNDDH